jgi:H+/Cl- antiporter ClcA
MNSKKTENASHFSVDRNVIPLIGKSALVGLGAGVAVGAFRWVVTWVAHTCYAAYDYVHARPSLILPLFAALVLLGLIVAFLMHKYPMANSSGIPQTKGLVTGDFNYSWWRILLAKFVGACLSTLAGLSLGREGPAIQIGGCVGQAVGDNLSKNETERRILISAGAGAGFGTVLGAPVAGMFFAMEDMLKYFSPSVLLSFFASATVSQYVAGIVFSLEPIFHFGYAPLFPLHTFWMLIPIGFLVGLAAIVYNRALLDFPPIYNRIIKKPQWLRPVFVFLLAGVMGLTIPDVLCGGDRIIEMVSSDLALKTLIILLVAKFLFFVVCFASGCPGGNHFPILVLGALLGSIFGYVAVYCFGFDVSYYPSFVVVAMSAYYASIARTPFTGLFLILESTRQIQLLLPMLITAMIAYATSVYFKNPPIYDALLDAMPKKEGEVPAEDVRAAKLKIDFGAAEQISSIMDFPLPEHTRIDYILRDEEKIFPDETTVILPGDELVIILSEDAPKGTTEVGGII